MTNEMKPVPGWKHIVAFTIDLFGSFFVFGYLTALITGQTTSEGFNLQGGPAFLAFGLMIAYFVAGNKYFGGTVGKRVLGITKG